MESVLYSCVVDHKPVYYYQGLVFVRTLTELAGVEPRSIVVHMVEGTPPAAAEVFRDLGVQTVITAPFNPRRPASNKFMQLRTDLLRACDYALLCDTDIAFAGPIDAWITGDRLRAKPVDFPRPPLAMWPAIFEALGVEAEVEAIDATHRPEPTYANNVNGGLYILPQPVLEGLREIWPLRYQQLLDRPRLLESLGDSSVHVFQIAFGVAMAELGLKCDPLPLELNLPTHVPLPEHRPIRREPLVLHYHHELDLSGRLLKMSNALVDRAIDRVNAVIEAHADLREVASSFAFKKAIMEGSTRRRLVALRQRWARAAGAG